jgi:hypothetical protein
MATGPDADAVCVTAGGFCPVAEQAVNNIAAAARRERKLRVITFSL